MGKFNGRLKRLEKLAIQQEPKQLTIRIKYLEAGEKPQAVAPSFQSGDGITYIFENRPVF